MRVLSFTDKFDLNLRQAFSLFYNDVHILQNLLCTISRNLSLN